MSDEVLGAVLAGGRGRRMGGEKAALEINGQTLAGRAVDALRSVGLDAALVLRPAQRAPKNADAFAVLRDEVEDAGPLGGLHALLRWLPVEWALVVACDQPFLAQPLLRGLLAQRAMDVDAIVGKPSEHIEPFPGLYRRTCLPGIEAALARGERSVQALLSSLRVRELSGRTLRRWDPSLLSYLNVNSPADLARARTLAGSTGAEADNSYYR